MARLEALQSQDPMFVAKLQATRIIKHWLRKAPREGAAVLPQQMLPPRLAVVDLHDSDFEDEDAEVADETLNQTFLLRRNTTEARASTFAPFELGTGGGPRNRVHSEVRRARPDTYEGLERGERGEKARLLEELDFFDSAASKPIMAEVQLDELWRTSVGAVWRDKLRAAAHQERQALGLALYPFDKPAGLRGSVLFLLSKL